jgi:competence protein ComFC
MQTLLRLLLDSIVPPRSTERLTRQLSLETLHALGRGEPLPYHDPRITALIWELKYYGSSHARALAGAYLADTVLAVASEEVGVPLLIPIPMHKNRRRERGHNQTELLCKALLSALGNTKAKKVLGSSLFGDIRQTIFVPGIAYAPRTLVRIIDTKHQQDLPRYVRLKNVHKSMQAQGVQGRVCIVVDDVTTTGATLAEAERALKVAGARAVHTVALAKS